MTGKSPVEDLVEVMRRLRDPEAGCPWDLEQTFATIAPYTIEEAYEVADAIRQGDMDLLEDELGDLLLQIVFYAQMSGEAGGFRFDDVARRIAAKMRARHPHVFGTRKRGTAAAVIVDWEAQKKREREARARAENRPPSRLDGVALALPALMRAEKLQKRAAGAGFDWPEAAAVAGKVREELAELEEEIGAPEPRAERLREEAGDLLFACVNLARKLGVDSEAALRDAGAKFEGRFRRVERRIAASGDSLEDCDPRRLDALWEQAKKEDRPPTRPAG